MFMSALCSSGMGGFAHLMCSLSYLQWTQWQLLLFTYRMLFWKHSDLLIILCSQVVETAAWVVTWHLPLHHAYWPPLHLHQYNVCQVPWLSEYDLASDGHLTALVLRHILKMWSCRRPLRMPSWWKRSHSGRFPFRWGVLFTRGIVPGWIRRFKTLNPARVIKYHFADPLGVIIARLLGKHL